MSWASGENHRGEVVGYAHRTICSQSDCKKCIDKGLYFTCGGLEGVLGSRGCGRHFCGSHLFYVSTPTEKEQGDDYDPEFDECEGAALCAKCKNVEMSPIEG